MRRHQRAWLNGTYIVHLSLSSLIVRTERAYLGHRKPFLPRYRSMGLYLHNEAGN